MAAISGNESVTVGTFTKIRPEFLHGTDPYFSGDLEDYDGDFLRQTEQAYRYSLSAGLEQLVSPEGYLNTAAIGVTVDGHTTLTNGFGVTSSFGASHTEPFLWTAKGEVHPLGHPALLPYPGALNRPDRVQSTIGTAIAADGSTVVGHTTSSELLVFDGLSHFPFGQAVLWREESGWIDLGSLASRRSEMDRTADELNSIIARGDFAADVSGNGERVVGTAMDLIRQRYVISLGAFHFPFDQQTPFLWDEARGMRDLAEVLALDYGLSFDGWSLGEATAISDDGTTIIGNGLNPAGEEEAWRAVLQRTTPHGDLDFDGDVDQFDYQTLTSNLGLSSDTAAVYYADGDLNADGLVDQLDVDALRARYDHRWTGDFNADGLVDLADYTLWRDLAGSLTAGLADSNGDGRVNQSDLAAWRANLGMVVSAISARAVPEPSALAAVAAGLVGVAARRRSRDA